ncbi:STAS domain-containing protein [Streptomyces sp. LRE541]|uniref:STAS domain-containing protein n=1 Tax=Streptomyces sp. LRE541 TaxID=2931983 RepID=UPI0024B10BB4|nr:STAS domain-containing protein [Streptomyces sp. LRE541]
MPLHDSHPLPRTDPLPRTELPGAHARCFARGEATVVELHGEIDVFTVGEITGDLDAATGQPVPHVIVDLRPVSFMDSSGLDLLSRAHRRARARDGGIRLISDQPRIRHLLRLTALDHIPLSAIFDDTPAVEAPSRTAHEGGGAVRTSRAAPTGRCRGCGGGCRWGAGRSRCASR